MSRKFAGPEVDASLVEQMLYRSEGDGIDFKMKPYELVKATDDKKGELVKDVVAFANGWHPGDRYILLGVEDGKGARGKVHGLQEDFDDAPMQEMVCSKLSTDPVFDYSEVTVEGKRVGVIRVAAHQTRPIWVKKRFGRLKPDEVWVRRSSGATLAPMDEVMRMRDATLARPRPSLDVRLGDPEVESARKGEVSLLSNQFEPGPEPTRGASSPGPFGTNVDMDELLGVHGARALKWARRKHRCEIARLNRVAFLVRNEGSVSLSDVRIRASVPKVQGALVFEELPSEPNPFPGIIATSARLPVLSGISVDDKPDEWAILCKIGKIQPGDEQWSDDFWMGAERDVTLQVVGKVFDDKLEAPVEFTIRVGIETVDAGLLPPDR